MTSTTGHPRGRGPEPAVSPPTRRRRGALRVAQVLLATAVLAVAATLIGGHGAEGHWSDRAVSSASTPPAAAGGCAAPALPVLLPPGSPCAGPAEGEPLVHVIASLPLLTAFNGSASSMERHGMRLRMAQHAGAGFTAPDDTGATFVTAATQIAPDSDAVIFVSGTADAGATRIDLLKAATRALSEAAGAAPDARLVVVGPVGADPTTPTDEVLTADLRMAARIAGALWVAPPRARPAAAAGTELVSALDRATTALQAG